MYSPKVMQTEALSLAAKEFLQSIIEKREPLTNGRDGLKIVQILEAAEHSIKNNGLTVKIDNGFNHKTNPEMIKKDKVEFKNNRRKKSFV